MEKIILEFIDSRIDDVAGELRTANAEYEQAVKLSNKLYDSIYSTVENGSKAVFDEDSFDLVMEFTDSIQNENSILQTELYKRGYSDCVKLLKMIGVLA